MMIGWKIKLFPARGADDAGDMLASLLMAAQEDPALRSQILALLQVPAAQRESLINSALHEMQLRGEPAAACQAFATLATESGARTARRLLGGSSSGRASVPARES